MHSRRVSGRCPTCGSERSVPAHDVTDRESRERRCIDCATMFTRDDVMRPMGAGSEVRARAAREFKGNPSTRAQEGDREYVIGGRSRRLTLDEAMSRADEIFERTGVVVSVERVERDGYRANGAKMRHAVDDFESAERALLRATGLRKLGSGSEITIGHNTKLRYVIDPADRSRDSIQVVLHHTPIVTYHQDGLITLNSGGYMSVTTKARMNEVTPPWLSIYQQGGEWFVRETGSSSKLRFHDGMVVGRQ